MSLITRMLDKILGKKQMRVLILGFDSPGRTTALYKLKLGEVVTTMPTIGFNVEDLPVGDTTMTIWDVGGRSKIRPLWRHYYPNTDAIIFAVRSSRRHFQEMKEEYQMELAKLLGEDELRDAVLMVWANFQDAEDAMTVQEITDELELTKLRSRNWNIFGTVATTGQGLHESMAWLKDAVTGQGQGASGPRVGGLVPAVTSAVAAGSSRVAGAVAEATAAVKEAFAAEREPLKPAAAAGPPREELKANNMEASLLRWLEEDCDEDATLKAFEDGSMKDLDHRDRLMVAWLLIKRLGRREAMPKIFEGAKRVLGSRFHETTLYFWVHMVHYASEATKNPMGNFKGFLLLNPQLVSSDLLLDFYSQEAIWSNAEAATQVVMPDKKPLPSLLSPVSPAAGQAPRKPPPTLKQLTDDEFVELLEQRRLPSWGHEAMLRTIFLLHRKEGRRKGGTDRIFAALEHAEGGMHSVTVSYFWLQMVTYCAAVVGQSFAEGSFEDFISRPQCQTLLNPGLISEHFTDGALAKGVSEMQLPDKKPLPNLIKRG